MTAVTRNEGAPLRVALLGFGTVGRSVARLLAAQGISGIVISHVFNRDIARKQALPDAAHVPASALWTEDIAQVLASDADVVVELMGGLDPAHDWVERALGAGKAVVTANKQLIAYHGRKLQQQADRQGRQLLYGAAVAGGVPVIPGLRQGLCGDTVQRISGILNGTCNFILSKMEEGASYADVLAEAQRLGYAEADPSADVDGFDARAKLCLLCRVAMQAELDPDQVPTASIAAIDAVDFAYAKELGCTIRQISHAERMADGIYARVAPMLIPLRSPIAWSHGTQNIVVSKGRFGGDVVFSGHGAGGEATAVAVLSDLLAVAQDARAVCLPATAVPITGDAMAPHYLRFIVDDKPGIVASIAGTLAKVGANIDSLLQRPGYPKQRLAFVVTTEPCPGAVINQAIDLLAELDCMKERPLALEILVLDDRDEPTA